MLVTFIANERKMLIFFPQDLTLFFFNVFLCCAKCPKGDKYFFILI